MTLLTWHPRDVLLAALEVWGEDGYLIGARTQQERKKVVGENVPACKLVPKIGDLGRRRRVKRGGWNWSERCNEQHARETRAAKQEWYEDKWCEISNTRLKNEVELWVLR